MPASRGRTGTDRPLTPRSIWHAPQLLDPICRYDCDIPVDGVATFVFTSAERAAGPAAPAGVRRRATPSARRRARAAAAALAARRHHRRRGGDGPAALGERRGRADRGRPAAGLRRLLAVRLLLARGARASARRARPTASCRTAASTATARMRFRPCPAAARSATGGCTASRRCSSATCSCRAGPVTASATARPSDWPVIPRPTLRWRRRLQRGGVLRVVLLDLSEYRSTVTGL